MMAFRRPEVPRARRRIPYCGSMKYLWAAGITSGVLLLAVAGIIAARRWVSTKKHKIALDNIIGLVIAGVALASGTFIGALQVFPSPSALPTPANVQSTAPCPNEYTGALIQPWPKNVKRGSHVTIAGDEFPGE